MQNIPFLSNIEDAFRQFIARLDKIILLLSESNQKREEEYTAIMLSSLVPMLPAFNIQETVGIQPVQLAKNDSVDLLRVDITNGDFAQPLYLGGLDVSVNNGRIVNPQDTVSYVLRRQDNLYGVVAVASISVRVSFLTVPINFLKQGGS